MYDPWQIVREFENSLAEYCGAPYAVAVDSCTAAIYLSLRFFDATEVWIPAKTHISVPMTAIHAGARVLFTNEEWRNLGEYRIRPYDIWDSACLLSPKSFSCRKGHLVCLSFDYRKHLPIGRGGAILCSEVDQRDWLRRARYFGRPEKGLHEEDGGPTFVGWKLYMDPERAARGLVLLDQIEDKPEPAPIAYDFPDLRQYEVFRLEAADCTRSR